MHQWEIPGRNDIRRNLKSRKSSSPVKISRRDLAVVAAKGLTGGTTIAGTMILAHMAGIKVFATGVLMRLALEQG